MKNVSLVLVSVGLAVAATVGAGADSKIQQRTQMKMEGLAGGVAGLLGGRSAREGTVTTIAIKGDRRMSTTEATAELVDLAAEKIYRIDLRGKTYTVRTFDEIRKQIEKAESRVGGDDARARRDSKQPEMEFDVDIRKTGQKKTIAGYPCEQIIMTLTGHEKGKTVDQGGGMVLTSDMWMAARVPAVQDSRAFAIRYAQKLYGSALPSMQAAGQAMTAYPGVAGAMARMEKEGTKLDGTPILTTMTVSAGGASRDKALSTIFTTVTEVLTIEGSADAADVEIPAGFRQK